MKIQLLYQQSSTVGRDHYASLLILQMISALKRDARHVFRKSGMVRLGAYQKGMYVASSARGFHRSRIDEGFPMHARQDWGAVFAVWRSDQASEIIEIEQILAEAEASNGKMVGLVVD